VVTNHADGSLLKSMMDNLRLRHPVLVTPPRQFNIKEPDLKFNTIYRILDISNDAARRQLIIGHGAEQAILIEDLDEANHLMADRRPEDNIAQCYSLNAHKPGFGHRVGGSHGAMSVTPVGRWESMSRMKTMGTAQIDAVANDINRYEKEFQQLRSDFRDAEQEVTARDTAVRNYKRIRRQLDVNRSRQEELMEELDAKIEEMAADGRLGSLEHQLKV
jgi:chromosome segregation ATPase